MFCHFSAPRNLVRRKRPYNDTTIRGVDRVRVRNGIDRIFLTMRIQSLNHSTYQHTYHIVWWTKYRYQWLKPYVIKKLQDAFEQTYKKYPTLCIHIWNADKHHIHLQIEIPSNNSNQEVAKTSERNLNSSKRCVLIRTASGVLGIYLQPPE